MHLFHRIYGSGIPLVALHGLYASSDTWMGLVPELQQLCRLILVDQRNHGRSPHAQEHSHKLMADDLLLLLNELGINKAVLLGHSMGGKVAMQFALYYPERVKGLIVEDISPRAYTELDTQFGFHRNIIKAMLGLSLEQLHSRSEAEDKLNAIVGDLLLCRFLLKNLYRDKNGKFEWKANLNSFLANFDQLMMEVDSRNLKFCSAVQFIKGEQSDYMCAKDEEFVRNIFPNSSIECVSCSGHWPHIEQQEKFVEIVKRYIYLLKD